MTSHIRRISVLIACIESRLLTLGVFVLLAVSASADAPLQPLPLPEYSFDRISPSVLGEYFAASDLLTLIEPDPSPVLPGISFELPDPDDDVDALSTANSDVDMNTLFMLLFSVDRGTIGIDPPEPELINLGVPYNVLDQAWRGHGAGDQFCTTDAFTRWGAIETLESGIHHNNFLSRNNFDEGGTDFGAQPPTHAITVLPPATPQDRVDAMARLLRTQPEGEIAEFFFSLTPASPSLFELSGPAAASGANIFHYSRTSQTWLGGCCFSDQSCEIFEMQACWLSGGYWLGPGSQCADCPPYEPTPEACCYGGSTCEVVDRQECQATGGWWLGPNTSCAMCGYGAETIGACCFERSSCLTLTESDCLARGGMWLGPDVPCATCFSPPPDMGACCFANPIMNCDEMTIYDCGRAGGLWLGPDTTCEICDSVPPSGLLGACCFENSICELLDPSDCFALNGWWLGPDTACDACPGQVVGDAVTLYADFGQLQLDASDDIDALIVFDAESNGSFGGTDQIIFSLAPGSPSLLTIPGASAEGAAADLFTVSFGQSPTLYASARDLGLGARADNVDALDFHALGVDANVKSVAVYGIRADEDKDCDLDDDGDVDLGDLSTLLAGYGACVGQGDYNPRADFDNDGCILLTDLARLLTEYGRKSE